MLLVSSPLWAKWSVTTYNIRNFDKDMSAGRTNMPELVKILKDVQSDVMAFEEIVNKKAFDELIKKNLPGYKYEISGCGGGGKQNLAIAYNPKAFDFVSKKEDLTFSGTASACGSLRPVFLVTLKNKQAKKDFTFGAVHLKAGGNQNAFQQRWQQYEMLVNLAKAYDKQNLILLGDFNSTGYNIKDQDFVKFEEFINDANMRTMTESLGCTNYWAGTQGGAEFQSSILDHIVVPEAMVSEVSGVKVGAHCAKMECRPARPSDLGVSFEAVSDHCPVQVSFK